jgi:hypothetical protein
MTECLYHLPRQGLKDSLEEVFDSMQFVTSAVSRVCAAAIVANRS